MEQKITCPRCGHDVFHIVEVSKGKRANIIKLECENCKRRIKFKTQEDVYF